MSEGRCLCGAVRFRVDPPFAFFGHCHCAICRKHHGSSFVTWLAVAPDAFAWLEGEARVRRYESSAHAVRPWCEVCGSSLPNPGPRMTLVPAGGVVDELPGTPTVHIFVGSKAPWVELADDLPRHETWMVPESSPRPVERPQPPLQPGAISGGCLCGAVAFELAGPPAGMRHCHCRRCRLARAAAHATNLFGAAESLRFLRGRELVEDYPLPGADRFGVAFCRDCGGHVARVVAGRPYAVVPAGAIDGDPGIRPSAHIFVGSKAEWFPITDGLPQHAESPPTS
ncbi:MAG TPA: GFA family protein [Thermoanaerobaculia bacterium]|nr:GFA family protein [Thermoanaerobaculia bacterium]